MLSPTALAVLTAPISLALLLGGGVLWAGVLRFLGADLANPSWALVVFPLWFATACGWGALLNRLDPDRRRTRRARR